MHFQLFIPNRRGADPAHLDAVGLDTMRAGALFGDVAKGPDGHPGVIIAWTPAGSAKLGFRPETQDWMPAVPRDGLPARRYWIGVERDAPPSPTDLKRSYQSPGAWVQLGDGREWLLPRAEELPRDMILADDGTPRFAVQRRYHDFYVAALRWREFFASAQPGETYEYAALCDFVLAGLAVNYQLTIELAQHFKLFVAAGPSHPQSVTRAALAVLGFQES